MRPVIIVTLLSCIIPTALSWQDCINEPYSIKGEVECSGCTIDVETQVLSNTTATCTVNEFVCLCESQKCHSEWRSVVPYCDLSDTPLKTVDGWVKQCKASNCSSGLKIRSVGSKQEFFAYHSGSDVLYPSRVSNSLGGPLAYLDKPRNLQDFCAQENKTLQTNKDLSYCKNPHPVADPRGGCIYSPQEKAAEISCSTCKNSSIGLVLVLDKAININCNIEQIQCKCNDSLCQISKPYAHLSYCKLANSSILSTAYKTCKSHGCSNVQAHTIEDDSYHLIFDDGANVLHGGYYRYPGVSVNYDYTGSTDSFCLNETMFTRTNVYVIDEKPKLCDEEDHVTKVAVPEKKEKAPPAADKKAAPEKKAKTDAPAPEKKEKGEPAKSDANQSKDVKGAKDSGKKAATKPPKQ